MADTAMDSNTVAKMVAAAATVVAATTAVVVTTTVVVVATRTQMAEVAATTVAAARPRRWQRWRPEPKRPTPHANQALHQLELLQHA
jgi:hypothetical protein